VLADCARVCGIPVHIAEGPLLLWQAARAIRRRLQEHPIDLVHANEAHAVTAAWLARAHRRVPFIISRRVGYPLKRNPLALARYRAASRIIAISRWVAAQAAASGAPQKKITVVYEGVEIPAPSTGEARQAARARWGVKPEAPLFGCVAVLLPDKGQEWLIRALALVRTEFPNSRLLLAGDGPCRPRLEQATRELDLTDAVIFAGFVNDIESVYAALDAFLFPSLFEGLGTSLQAAMAWELPAVTTGCSGPGEVVENERTGLIVGARPEGFANAMLRLLREPSFARRLGIAARRSAIERFSAAQMVEGTLSVYREALRERLGSSR
jgi:glycosyltransferase involved in cell wall biosynthesis